MPSRHFYWCDMPHTRANPRDPETIIAEWYGTCSGKYDLLKELFTELGYSSRPMRVF